MNPHILNHDFWSSHWDTTSSIGQSKITKLIFWLDDWDFQGKHSFLCS